MSAGMWVKWERGLVRKPEVMQIARVLKCTPQHAAACCMQVWEWVEDTTTDGVIKNISPADVSFAAGIPGIGEAMLNAGWLIQADDGLIIPNFDRHNSEPAKRRAEKARYMRVYRAEKRSQKLNEREKSVTNF